MVRNHLIAGKGRRKDRGRLHGALGHVEQGRLIGRRHTESVEGLIGHSVQGVQPSRIDRPNTVQGISGEVEPGLQGRRVNSRRDRGVDRVVIRDEGRRIKIDVGSDRRNIKSPGGFGGRPISLQEQGKVERLICARGGRCVRGRLHDASQARGRRIKLIGHCRTRKTLEKLRDKVRLIVRKSLRKSMEFWVERVEKQQKRGIDLKGRW